jgi:ABC-type histidine transport system ATPase subunit
MIEMKNITKIYRLGEVEVLILKGINLQIVAGDYVSIMGHRVHGMNGVICPTLRSKHSLDPHILSRIMTLIHTDRLNDPSLRVIEVDMNPLISPSSQHSPSNVQKTKEPEQ